MAVHVVSIRRIRNECDTTVTWSPEKVVVHYEAIVVKQTGVIKWV